MNYSSKWKRGMWKRNERNYWWRWRVHYHPQTFVLLLPFQDGHLYVFLLDHKRDILMTVLQDSSEIGITYMMTRTWKHLLSHKVNDFTALLSRGPKTTAARAKQEREQAEGTAGLLPPCSGLLADTGLCGP